MFFLQDTGGRHNTVDLLVKIVRFVRKEKNIFSSDSSWSELDCTRRSRSGLRLPFQKGFPG